MTFVILLAIGLLQAPASNIPVGWYQLDMLSYHGPTGYFHDSVSGALVQYQFGWMPPLSSKDLPGSSKCKTRAIKGTIPTCIMNVEAIPKSSQIKLQVFIGPIESIYATYWTQTNTNLQEERARALMLISPLWERSVAGQKVLERDAKGNDLLAVKIGMSIDDVYLKLGYPNSLQSKSDAGFSAYYAIWSKKGPMKNWSFRIVELVFSKDRILKTVSDPKKS